MGKCTPLFQWGACVGEKMTGVMTRMSSSEEPASQLFRALWLHGRVEMG